MLIESAATALADGRRIGLPAGWRETRRKDGEWAFASADNRIRLTLGAGHRAAAAPPAEGARRFAAALAETLRDGGAETVTIFRSGAERILHAEWPAARRWIVIGPAPPGLFRRRRLGVLTFDLAWEVEAAPEAVAQAVAFFEEEAHRAILSPETHGARRAAWMAYDPAQDGALTDLHRLEKRRFFDAITLRTPRRFELERSPSGRLRLFDRKGGPGTIYVDCEVEALPGGVARSEARRAARAVIAGAAKAARSRGGEVLRDRDAPDGRVVEEIQNAFHMRALWEESGDGAAAAHRMYGWCVAKPAQDLLIIASFTVALPVDHADSPECAELVEIMDDQIRLCALEPPPWGRKPPRGLVSVPRAPEAFRGPLTAVEAARRAKPFDFAAMQLVTLFDGALSFRAPMRWRPRRVASGAALFEPEIETGALQIAFRPRLARLFGDRRMRDTVTRKAGQLRANDIAEEHGDAPGFRAAIERLADGVLIHYAFDETEGAQAARNFGWSLMRRGRRNLAVAEFVLSIPLFMADDDEMAALPLLIDSEVREASLNIE